MDGIDFLEGIRFIKSKTVTGVKIIYTLDHNAMIDKAKMIFEVYVDERNYSKKDCEYLSTLGFEYDKWVRPDAFVFRV